MTKRKSRYPSLLNKPIRISWRPSTLGEFAKWNAEIKCVKLAKADLLFEHFSIPIDSRDSWQRLALMLAEKHVPGFQLDKHWKPRGAPRKIRHLDLLGLLMHVDNCIQENGNKTKKAVLRKYLMDWYKKNGKKPPSEKKLNTETEYLQKLLCRTERLYTEGKIGLSPFFRKSQ